MKAQRTDPPEVRARKWAQAWEWESFRILLETCVCRGDGGWLCLPLGPWEGSFDGACRARALLWRREVAWRERVRQMEDDHQDEIWESWGEDC